MLTVDQQFELVATSQQIEQRNLRCPEGSLVNGRLSAKEEARTTILKLPCKLRFCWLSREWKLLKMTQLREPNTPKDLRFLPEPAALCTKLSPVSEMFVRTALHLKSWGLDDKRFGLYLLREALGSEQIVSEYNYVWPTFAEDPAAAL